MLVCFLAFILIALIAAYYATQGVFSAMISLIAAVFASVLAMGLFEMADGPIAGFKPAYARGTTFLVIFLLTLSACRLGADYLVPNNIRLKEKAVDIAAGAIPGFFAAMVIVGSLLIGIEMLPLPTSLLSASWMPASMGFDRFPAAGGMQGERPGTVAVPQNVWLYPDRFTLLLWDGVSGRGLDRARAFASVHPDLIAESYGYRNTVQYGGNTTLAPDLLNVDAAYYSDDPAVLQRCHISGGSDKAAVVRIDVKRGDEPPHASAEQLRSKDGKTDNYFCIAASEIRMVTDKGNQYYPIGYLQNGVTFQPMKLAVTEEELKQGIADHLVDDYVGGKVIEDWVFQINKDEKPKFIEVKELARHDLAVDDAKGMPKPPAPALAASAYPKRAYKAEVGTIIVTVQGSGGPASGVRVYLMSRSTKLSLIQSALQSAYNNIKSERDDIQAGTGPWVAAKEKPGIPNDGLLHQAQNWGIEELNKAAGDVNAPVEWSKVLPPMLIGTCKPDADENMRSLPRYFENTVEPLLNLDRANSWGTVTTGADGKAEFKNISPGNYVIICSNGGEDAYNLWTQGVKLDAKKTLEETLDPNNASFKLKK